MAVNLEEKFCHGKYDKNSYAFYSLIPRFHRDVLTALSVSLQVQINIFVSTPISGPTHYILYEVRYSVQ